MKFSRRAIILGGLGLLAEGLIGRAMGAELADQEPVLSAAVDSLHFRLSACDHRNDPQAAHQRRDCRPDTCADGPTTPTAELPRSR